MITLIAWMPTCVGMTHHRLSHQQDNPTARHTGDGRCLGVLNVLCCSIRVLRILNDHCNCLDAPTSACLFVAEGGISEDSV